MAQVGLVTPTHAYGVSGLPQAFFFFFLDMRLLKKVCFWNVLLIFGQYWSILINIRYCVRYLLGYVMHPEAYLERLACTKQVSGVWEQL